MVCGLGECGACAVLIDGVAARACVIPIEGCAGANVVTLEGLGTREQSGSGAGCLHPRASRAVRLLSQRHDHHHQGATDAQSTPSEHEVLEALRYNLCRCGAHIEIVRAAMRAAGHCGRGARLMSVRSNACTARYQSSVPRSLVRKAHSRPSSVIAADGAVNAITAMSISAPASAPRSGRSCRRARCVLCPCRRDPRRHRRRAEPGRDDRERNNPDHRRSLAQGPRRRRGIFWRRAPPSASNCRSMISRSKTA